MTLILGIISFMLCISLHELGHAFAMRREGVEMEEICLLGLGGPRLFTFYLPSIFGNTPVTIRLLILGAFVRPTAKGDETMDNLSFHKYSDVLGAGVIANILYAAVLISIDSFFFGSLTLTGIFVISLMFMIGLFPRYSCHLVVPLGIVTCMLLVKGLYDSPVETVKSGGSIVTIVQDIKGHATSMHDMLKYAGILSIGLGLFNALPLFPLDGGKIAYNFIEKNYNGRKKEQILNVFIYSTLGIIFILLVWSVGNDLFKLFF